MSCSDFKILQANLRKSIDISQSLLNDDALQSYSVLLTTEPLAKLNGSVPFTVPLTHTYWQPFFPLSKYTPQEHPRSPVFRAMIWVNKAYTSIQQVEIVHRDICAVILILRDRKIFFASIYVPCSRGSRTKDDLRLKKRLDLLQQAFLLQKQQDSNLELVITGDFNRWDLLWGGNSLASHTRQGEGQLLIDLMSDLDLQLLLLWNKNLHRGYKKWVHIFYY